ncbi:MAG: hypothetical protein IJC73_08940, partial [Lentisphaeria bacterium]|nr:hypothetical protein [Lentisphaeria bacterium]
GKQDAAYRIEAEVTAPAHRRQSGSGKIPIAAVPFRVYSWLNGNFFEPGERIVLNVKAQRMDGQPVAGRGETRIYRLRLENGQETRSYDPLHVIHFDTTSENAVKELPFEIRVPGIYIAVTTIRTVKRENSESIARIRVRSVRGGAPVFSSRQLEMLTDRELYRPGDDIKLLFSSRQRSGNVLCFIRSTGGGGGEYRVVPLENHSGTLTFRTSDADSPNLFVDAAMFADGRWHLVSREIPVPPARNMLLVQLKTVPEKLSPGDSGKILLQLQDDTGGPTGGDVTVAVYDQAIEDFSGGSNIPGIMDFFWGWKRYHFPQWMHLHDGTGGPRSMMMQPAVLARNGVALAESADNMPMATVAGSGTAGEPVMRQRFADRLLWVARSRVDDSGKLEIPFVLPDNLTRWRVRIWAMAPGCRAGEGTADFTVSQPFVARLATPVSLNAGDRFEIKGVLHNLTDREQQVNLQCLASPVKAVGADVPLEITVPAHGTTEIAREVIAERPGSIRVSLRAGNDAVGDGISQDLTVHPPGIRQFYTAAGTLAPDGESLSFPVVLPENVEPATVSLMLNTAPSLTGAMLEVLPLLTSQKSDIFSRIGNFLPTVMAWQACEKAGIKDCDLTLPPAVPLSPDFDRQKKTVSGATLNRESFKNMTREHLQMIAALQNSDGGWGWFSGATERSWPDTTAATVQALAALKDFPEISGSLQRGIEWLRRDAEKRFKKLQQQPDAVPADVDAVRVEALADAGAPKPELADWLYQRRGKLPVLSLLRLARAARQWPEMQKEAAELQKLLKQYVVYDNVAKRHRLAFPVDRFRDPGLAAALYIRLLAGSDPQSPLLPDLARQLVEAWRYAPEENSARSAGEGVRALADWIAVSGEKLEPREIEILLDGKTIRRIQVPVEKMATFDPRTLITPQQLMPGPHEITIRQQGKGFLYCHMAMAFDNRDDTIPAAGRELIVSRKLFLLTPDTGMTFAFDDAGHPVSAEAARWTRSEIAPGTVIPSGAMLEEELTVEAVADCNYVRIRAPRPAGFYPLGAQSGWLPDNPLPVYGEFHPSYTDLYCHRVRRGKNVVRTRMVAETPGYYRWPAAEVMALQVPVLRGNSASSAVEIQAK